MKVKINRFGQITIPWLLRYSVGAQAGDELWIEVIAPGRLLVTTLVTHSPWGETRHVDPVTLPRMRLKRERKRHSPALP